jgi:nucleoside-diphosphate-sugar epimerase
LINRLIPTTILRCHHIYGPPEEPGPAARSFLASRGRSVTILGRGSQRLSPVYREDVVEAIVQAALDPAGPVGTFELAGPETMTAVEFAHQLNRGPIRVRSLPAWLGRLLPSLPAALVEVMLSDLPPSPAAAATPGRFGIRLRRVEDVWRPEVSIATGT